MASAGEITRQLEAVRRGDRQAESHLYMLATYPTRITLAYECHVTGNATRGK